MRNGLFYQKFCRIRFRYDTEVSASRGINIQRLILAEIVAVLSAPLLVLGSKGLLRPATNALAMPKSSDKVHPLLAAIGAGRTGKQAICVWEGGVQQGEQRLIGADLLILLSDIDGLYTDDPRTDPQASFISLVEEITPELLSMGKDTSGSDVGTGGMSAKLAAARIATDSGSDMIIANGEDVDIIHDLMKGEDRGTLFMAHANLDFDLMDYINTKY